MTAKVVRIALVAALCAVVLYAIVAGYEWWAGRQVAKGDAAGAARVQLLWNADKMARDKAQAAAVSAARADEQKMAAAAAEGEKNARDRAEARAKDEAAAARRSAAAAGGLRGDLAALDNASRGAGIPNAASCPGEFAKQRDHAIRARALFGACVAEYRLLAEDAAADSAHLQLRFESALSWIRATGAPGAQDLRQ